MKKTELEELISKQYETISELRAEILELKIEVDEEIEPITIAQEIIERCKDENGKIDFEKLELEEKKYSEVAQHLSVYAMFNDDSDYFSDFDE